MGADILVAVVSDCSGVNGDFGAFSVLSQCVTVTDDQDILNTGGRCHGGQNIDRGIGRVRCGLGHRDASALAHCVGGEVIGHERDGAVAVVLGVHIDDAGAVIGDIIDRGVGHALGNGQSDGGGTLECVARDKVNRDVIGHIIFQQIVDGAGEGLYLAHRDALHAGDIGLHGNAVITFLNLGGAEAHREHILHNAHAAAEGDGDGLITGLGHVHADIIVVPEAVLGLDTAVFVGDECSQTGADLVKDVLILSVLHEESLGAAVFHFQSPGHGVLGDLRQHRAKGDTTGAVHGEGKDGRGGIQAQRIVKEDLIVIDSGASAVRGDGVQAERRLVVHIIGDGADHFHLSAGNKILQRDIQYGVVGENGVHSGDQIPDIGDFTARCLCSHGHRETIVLIGESI